WFPLTLLGKPHYDDRKASEERKILWRLTHHDPYTEPDDWENFIQGKKNERTQNHRASRDKPTNTIYDNTASISPSGLTTTMPSQSISDVATSDSCLACRIPSLVRSATDGLALMAVYEQQRKIGRSASSNEAEFFLVVMIMVSYQPFDRTICKISSHR
ncbi:hypothetical protein EDD85DRAFT_862034, partial [Armillaria nabsnona]